MFENKLFCDFSCLFQLFNVSLHHKLIIKSQRYGNRLKMILAIVNNKGGVGKTTTVQNLAAGMLRKDKNLRILEIDLDPQCNLTLLNHAPEGCATVLIL